MNAAQIFSHQGRERVSIATLSQGQLWLGVDGETWCACMNLSDCRLVRSITPAGMDVKGGGKAAVHRSVRASRIGNMRVPRAPKRGERQGSQGKGVDLRSKYTPPTLTLVEKASWTLAVRRNESDGLVCYMTLDTDQAPDWEISCSSGSLCSYWIDVDRRPAACGRPSERTSTCICRIVTRPYGAGASLYRYGMVLQCRLSDAQLPCRRMCSSTGTIHPQCFRFSFAQRVC